MPRAIAARGLRRATGFPSISTRPESARSAPKSSRANSVRPEPSNPASPTTSPALISRSNGSMAPLRPSRVARNSGGAVVSRWAWCSDAWCSIRSKVLSSRPSMADTRPSRSSCRVGYSPTNMPLRNTVIRSEIS